jgi:hypothetical protein
MELAFLGLVALLALALLWTLFALTAAVAGRVAKLVLKSSPRQAERVLFAKRTGIAAFALFLCWQTYTAIYPDDSFYLVEYQTVTGRLAPPNAKVIEKHATNPDFHGDYCSFSRISLPAASYESLMNDLSKDRRFDLNSREFVSMGFTNDKPLPNISVVSTFTRNDTESDQHYSILFLAEGNLVEVHLCLT